MAAPNIVSVATIIGESQGFQLDTTTTTALITVASNKLVKINRISVANIDGTNAADITIEVSVDNGSNYVAIASTISVPADATLSFLENPIYLDETDILAVTASANSDLTYFVSYEEITD